MKANKTTHTGVSSAGTPWQKLDHHVPNTNFSIHVTKGGTGDLTYSIQGTLDELEGNNILGVETSVVGFDLVSGATGTLYRTFSNTPLAAVRLLPSSVSGVNNVVIRLLQSGN